MVTKKDYLEAKIDQVQAGIFQNQTLIEWLAEGGSVDPIEADKAKVAIEKDEKWLAFLTNKLNELQASNN